MIWCRFQKDELVSYGIVEGDTVVTVEGDPFSDYRTTASKLKLSEVKLLVPVIPGTFYAIGSNYHDHVVGRAQVKGTKPKFYDTPRVGYRANSALIATGEDIVKPKDSGPRFEYEGELVAVIGRPARRVSPKDAAECIFGWTIGNDLTERDWQRADPTNLRGKNADTFKPRNSGLPEFRTIKRRKSGKPRLAMGPWIVTGLDPRDMTTNVRLNGKTVHSFPTGDMLFGAAEVISAVSRYNTLSRKDVVWLGTDEVPQSVKPGEVIEIEITGIGVLRNRVVAET
jgi:2-keto-4-pentenoate hydratase/2-oxohepta-3-ene-1,7-dioic acid hydratase in catechol pathway